MQARHPFPSRRQRTSKKPVANPNASRSTSSYFRFEVHKTFVTVTPEIEQYLERAAYVEVFGRQIKEDDVQNGSLLKANASGSLTTRRLANPNAFFVACSSRDVVHQLMMGGRIKGNGFSLRISHWEVFLDIQHLLHPREPECSLIYL